MAKNLETWMHENGHDQYTVAPLLGFSQSAVSRVLSRKQQPTTRFMNAALKLTGGEVTWDSFLATAEDDGSVARQARRLEHARRRGAGRAAAMTPERRREIGRIAASARWSKQGTISS